MSNAAQQKLYQRKLLALLGNPELYSDLACWGDRFSELQQWWQEKRKLIEDIASSSDRINLDVPFTSQTPDEIEIRHPISGQAQHLVTDRQPLNVPQEIARETDSRIVFWWFWRFLPALESQNAPQTLLRPAHSILPDCPIYSYRSTASAIAGALYPQDETTQQYPYLLLFTFSPIQEFIKASRKFLDFWSGSYLLHYLSGKLCWYVAQEYGADAIITPSLWGQEIIDALLCQNYSQFEQFEQFKATFREVSTDGKDPMQRFDDRSSMSLATAGFPNTIAVLVGGKEAAQELGEQLCQQLRTEWQAIAHNVREGIPEHSLPWLRKGIRDRVIEYLENPKNQEQIDKILQEFAQAGGHAVQNEHDIDNWKRQSCWEWRKLWDAQIENTWQPYWTAVPLGDPQTALEIVENEDYEFDKNWIDTQEKVAQTRAIATPPVTAETIIYQTLNNGTWWGSIQARCAQVMQAIKNTRKWEIPVAPGVRSTLSGQLSALHPQFRYCGKFREGYGLPLESMRLFWRLMSQVYPGLFDGSEMLNALELTKRMAWVYGGVGEALGVDFDDPEAEVDYGQFIRFPNLSAIASARFIHQEWQQNRDSNKVKQYQQLLYNLIKQEFPESSEESENREKSENFARFAARTRGRPNQIPKTDAAINPQNRKGNDYNGVMFSGKWLADDMGLNRDEINHLRPLIEKAHRDTGFKDGSPSDWWVMVAGDGDGMGRYVSGQKLHPYERYLTVTNPEELRDRVMRRDRYPNLDDEAYQEKQQQFLAALTGEDTDPEEDTDALLKLKKRMGPATHIGLNRALLDFSNRLVPFITEKRFCGRVVYSGGDDVMALLPLEDILDYLRCLRAAWCGAKDPYQPQPGDPDLIFEPQGGYWRPTSATETFQSLPNRPLFTMGEGATMSLGITIVHKSVPLPAALEALWEAESDRAKEMKGAPDSVKPGQPGYLPAKNGLCFRVLYGSGNCLEALIKGELYEDWRNWMDTPHYQPLSSLLYRLAEELPRRAAFTPSSHLIAKAADAIAQRQDEAKVIEANTKLLISWLERWEDWARPFHPEGSEDSKKDKNQLNTTQQKPPGVEISDLSNILRFSAFWLDKMQQRQKWQTTSSEES